MRGLIFIDFLKELSFNTVNRAILLEVNQGRKKHKTLLNLDVSTFERLSYVRKLGSNIQPFKHRQEIRLFNKILDAVKVCYPINK